MHNPLHTLRNAFGQIQMAEYGGQVLSWITAEGHEQLYTPDLLQRYPGRALRGGVPVCFPQFSGRGSLPKHGLVRTRPWQLLAKTETALMMAIENDAETQALWPYAFRLLQTVILDENGLTLTLDFHNRSHAPLVFTAALHTYLRVPDVTQCTLHGLHGYEYEDAADAGRYKTQQGPLCIEGEVDRVFANAPGRLDLQRPGHAPLQILQGGFADTVVWCPGSDVAAGFTDMPTEDWQRMLCVEAAAAVQPITVLADGRWQGWQQLSEV